MACQLKNGLQSHLSHCSLGHLTNMHCGRAESAADDGCTNELLTRCEPLPSLQGTESFLHGLHPWVPGMLTSVCVSRQNDRGSSRLPVAPHPVTAALAAPPNQCPDDGGSCTDGDGGSVLVGASSEDEGTEGESEEAGSDRDSEEDDVWRPETATPAWRHASRRSRHGGRRTGSGRSLASALDLVRPCLCSPLLGLRPGCDNGRVTWLDRMPKHSHTGPQLRANPACCEVAMPCMRGWMGLCIAVSRACSRQRHFAVGMQQPI